MSIGVWWHGPFGQLHTRRYRQVLIASLITALTSATLLGLIGVTRWRGQQALASDTRTVVAQATEQLKRALTSRRGTLTFIRDTLNRRSDLTDAHLNAIGASAVQHTRHLLATGRVTDGGEVVWWTPVTTVDRAALSRLNQAIVRRTRIRGSWRVPSTFVTSEAGDPLLVMLEPLKSHVSPRQAVVGVFALTPLVADFFSTGLRQQYPVQLTDEQTILYRSAGWQVAADGSEPVILEQPLRMDALRWTIRMQPGDSGIVQTLSWFSVLLIGLSILAGLGVTAIVWLLAARTWLLQRAVARRTAALRRTLERVRQLATTDELTGLYNRRSFLSRWAWECHRAKRYQRPLGCLMIDLNGFKQVNDRLGHAAGDLVLRQVAAELKRLLRESDILARFGGDEFVVALPETDRQQLQAVAQKLREFRLPLSEAGGSRLPPVSLSVGSSWWSPNHSPEAVIQAADQSLYATRHAQRTDRTHRRAGALLS